MNKIISSIMVALLIAVSFYATALAEGEITRAIPKADLSDLCAYAGFELDDATGDWRLLSDSARALSAYANDNGLTQYGYEGILLMYVQIEGNANTGHFTPYLHVLHEGKAEDARAISIRVGDARYTLPLAPVDATTESESTVASATSTASAPRDAAPAASQAVSRQTREYSVPLDASGLAMIREVSGADSVLVRIHGEKAYTTRLLRTDNYDTKRARLEGMSLDCLDVFDALDWLDNDAYLFGTRDIERWERDTGITYGMERTLLNKNGIAPVKYAPQLDKEMLMLSPGSSGSQVLVLNKRLVELRLLAGYQESAYSTATAEAVRGLQKRYGLIQTGSADENVLRILFAGQTPDAYVNESTDEAIERITREPVSIATKDAKISLTSYWLAREVETSYSSGILSTIEVSDADHILFIVEGYVENMSGAFLSLSELPFTTAINDAPFYMTAKAETDGGRRFTDSLLPLERAKLLLFCELPTSAIARQVKINLELADTVLVSFAARINE